LRRSTAFTLIELLVVITVIVVLLALLTPALDKAIYQAELAICASRQKALTASVTTYALGHQRAYPTRHPNFRSDPMMIRWPVIPTAPSFDLRASLADYVPLPLYLDPLSGGIDLTDAVNDAMTFIYSNYNLYFGWGVNGQMRMRKIGDRFEFRGARFNIVVGDRDAWTVGTNVWPQHPDALGKLHFVVRQKFQGIGLGAYATQTASWWYRAAWEGTDGRGSRGTVDNNFTTDDGAVVRYTDVPVRDDRLALLPDYNEETFNAGREAQLPAVGRP
jgi:prepilin-type N-terminal cleavage/methylation domain-containing protein